MKLQFKIIRKKYYKILLSIIIIISLAVALLFGLMNGVLSVHKSIDNFIENNNYPDIKIITNLEDIEVLNKLNKNNFKSLNSRISISTILKKNNDVISVKASTFNDNDLSDFYVWKEIENKNDCYDLLVEKKFSDNNNLKLGDILLLKIGEEYYSFCISKIISVPEAMVSSPINGLWGSINDYGNVYINEKVLINETNKTKNNLLNELKEKEEEVKNKESNGLKEFDLARIKIRKALNNYNSQKSYYSDIKSELYDKKDELNNQKTKLLNLKKDYLNEIDTLKDLNEKIDKYVNAYNELSNDAKEYINNVIETKYPNIKIEDLEFISDIGYYIVNDKIDEIFDSSSTINQQIKDKISIMDGIKNLLETEYEYHYSEEVNELIEKMKNNEDITDTSDYYLLKFRLELYNIYGEITDENILYIEELNRTLLKEIYNLDTKLPFESFDELYNTLDSSRVLLPVLYENLKSQVKTIIEPKIDEFNSQKEVIKNKIQEKFNDEQNKINRIKEFKDLVYEYLKITIDDYVVTSLKEYINNTNDNPVEIIDNLIDNIDIGLNEVNTNINKIDSKLKTSYTLINNNQKELNKKYNLFKEEISNAVMEISNKKEEINNIKGYESKFNEININVNDFYDRETLLEDIKNELKDIEIKDSYTYEDSPVKNSINYNIVGMENVSIIVPTIIYIITLIILFLFISLIIKQSKSEIGILRLLGKSRNEIRNVYCINNLIISIFGIIIGFIFGGLLMLYIVSYYKNFIQLPTVVYEINGMSIILCIVITIFVVELATILATLQLDKITPIEVLNKERYQENEISKFTKKITSIFSPFRKFSLLVYIRNKKNLILGLICTSATFALIFTSLAYVASKDKIFNQYFDDRINYNVQLFEKSIEESKVNDIRSLEYIYSADILRYYNVVLKNGKKEASIIINALDNKNDYIRLYDNNNNLIAYPENGIVLEEHIASELGLKKGDVVTINEVPFEIVNISFQSLGRINYISINDSNKLISSFDSVVIKMDDSKIKEFINNYSTDDSYIYTVDYNNLRRYNKIEFDSYVIPALIIIIFSMIIGFIIILNINYYNIIDQKRNLSIFRSLGFHYKEISNNLFTQSFIQWLTSIIIGLPIGIILSKYVLKKVSSPRREYIYASGIKEILLTVVLVFMYIVISHIISMRKLKRIDITEEMKDRD